MHTEMWEHPAVQENLATLRRRGVEVVPPGVGRLAGGDEGPGRMAEPAEIVAAAAALLHPPARPLAGVRLLVTAGGTREPIDDVRVIANRSSGRQGHAIAEVALRRGAEVSLVTTSELPPPSGAVVEHVETAAEMAAAVERLAPAQDVVVMAAAVADFRPKAPHAGKLARAEGLPELVLEPTPDILAALVRGRRRGQLLVGFAAESGGAEAAVARGARKLAEKGVDLIVVNDVSAPGAGFGHETNAVTILGRGGLRIDVPLASKPTIAGAVLDAVASARAGTDGGAAGGRGERTEDG